MLMKYTIKGFKSFKEETVFDFHSTNYKILSETNVNEDGVLKGAIFVGANASGKSNAIIAIKFLLDMLFLKQSKINTDTTCLFSKDNIMSMSYEFLIDKKEIIYNIHYDRKSKLLTEDLFLDGINLLNRVGNSAKSTITENQIFTDISNESLFIREIYFNTKFRGNEVLQKWFRFLMDSIYFDLFLKAVEIYDESKEDDLEIVKYLTKHGPNEINSFFNENNFNQTIEFDQESVGEYYKIKTDQNSIFFRRKGIDAPIIYELESIGNRTLINLLPIMFNAIKNNSMLILDEFSSGFHNHLEELLIRYFMGKAKNSQIFLVSHSTNLLTNSLLRPDQMYTVNFIGQKGSTIKRFSSEKPREAQNIEKMYLGGVFNGLPNYKEADEIEL